MNSLRVNSLTSAKTLLPLDYYSLPFCRPQHGPQLASQNLGQFLAGDRIQSVPVDVMAKKDVYCERSCVRVWDHEDTTTVVAAIENQYKQTWILDNLDAAHAIPIGYTDSYLNQTFIYNHFNFEISFNRFLEYSFESVDIVGFKIQPVSIKHSFEEVYDSDSRKH